MYSCIQLLLLNMFLKIFHIAVDQYLILVLLLRNIPQYYGSCLSLFQLMDIGLFHICESLLYKTLIIVYKSLWICIF